MRGTRVRKFGVDCGNGIIPAYAGNTESDRYPFARSGDHPRVCGEHLLVVCVFANCWGSSPRMRGTPGIVGGSVGRAGIIPAYAGNTRALPTAGASDWDHPRVCGEHISQSPFIRSFRGSSPRMRGTPIDRRSHCWNGGDHPRVCGEHAESGNEELEF